MASADLIRACQHNNLEMVSSCLQHGASTREADTNGSLPIHWAAQSGSEDIVRCLVDADPESVMVTNNMNRVPLWYASRTGNEQLMTYMFQCNPEALLVVPHALDGDSKSEHGPSILADAIWYFREDYIVDLIAQGAVATTDPRLLFNAIARGFSRLTHHLFHRPSLDWIDETGETVLHVAMQSRQLDIVQLIVSGQSDSWLVQQLCHRNQRCGNTPLHTGIRSSDHGTNLDAVSHLLEVTADVLSVLSRRSDLRAAILNVDDDGCNLLHCHRTRCMPLFQRLVELMGAAGGLWDALHAHEKYGNLPLHSAIVNSFTQGVEYLVWLGSPLANTKDDHSPLFLAGSVFNQEMIRILLALGLTVTFPVEPFGPVVIGAFEMVLTEDTRLDIRYRVYFARSLLERLLIEC